MTDIERRAATAAVSGGGDRDTRHRCASNFCCSRPWWRQPYAGFKSLSGQRRTEDRLARAKQEAELAEVKRRAARLVDQVADGLLSGAAVKERLDILEARRTALEQEVEAEPANASFVPHPAAPQRFRALVEQLNAVLAMEDTLERRAAREAFRALIRKVVVVTPLAERGRCKVTVVTELAALVSEGGGGRVKSSGAGTRTAGLDTTGPTLSLSA